jgi:hypothetical protein
VTELLQEELQGFHSMLPCHDLGWSMINSHPVIEDEIFWRRAAWRSAFFLREMIDHPLDGGFRTSNTQAMLLGLALEMLFLKNPTEAVGVFEVHGSVAPNWPDGSQSIERKLCGCEAIWLGLVNNWQRIC